MTVCTLNLNIISGINSEGHMQMSGRVWQMQTHHNSFHLVTKIIGRWGKVKTGKNMRMSFTDKCWLIFQQKCLR